MFHAPECGRDRIFSSETRGIESDPEKTTDARWALEARNKSMGVVKDHVTHLGPRTSSHHGILHAGADRAVIVDPARCIWFLFANVGSGEFERLVALSRSMMQDWLT